MFASKLPWLSVVQMLFVVIVTLAVLFVTSNPLALLGLLFMWSAPPILPPMQGDGPVATGHGIGFLADIGDDD